jgi:predicted nucleotidyltransferase
VNILGKLIEKTIDCRGDLRVKVYVFGSFLHAENYNDIDILIIYDDIDFNDVKKLKNDIIGELEREFEKPVHFLTLLTEEIAQIGIDEYGEHVLLYDGF